MLVGLESRSVTATTSANRALIVAIVFATKAARFSVLDDIVLGAEREAGDVLDGVVPADHQNVMLAVAAGAGLTLGIITIGSMDTTMPGLSSVSMSSRSSTPASRP